MFKIKKLAEDMDALVILLGALVLALLVAFMPEVAWDRLVERGRFLAPLAASPLVIAALRYWLRVTGAKESGRVMTAIAADPAAPDITAVVAPHVMTNAPAEAGTALDAGLALRGVPTDIDVVEVLRGEYRRATTAQADASTDAGRERATAAVIAVTDVASKLGVIL